MGSGAGVDVFIAAEKVGKSGKVIGVDMTPEMINKARINKKKGDYPQVEFRLGEIEHLPVADDYVDVIISNCVINLSPKKEQVFRDAIRVLKPGGYVVLNSTHAHAILNPLSIPLIESFFRARERWVIRNSEHKTATPHFYLAKEFNQHLSDPVF